MEAIRREARLRGEIEALGEDKEYDDPLERLTRVELDRLAAPERDAKLADLADTVSAGYSPPPPTPTKSLPGSAEKIAIMDAREARREAVTHEKDARLETLSAALRVVNHDNGTPEILGTVSLRGETAQREHILRMTGVEREKLEECYPSLWDVFSGEAWLRRIEARISRPLDAAARAMGAWPWRTA
jgi:hypothetical protein